MATTRLSGATLWRGEFAKPGTRILYTSNYSLGGGLINGQYWNKHASAGSDTSPAQFPLKDISGRDTCVGIRTKTAFTGQVGAIAYADVSGYNDDVWDYSYYTGANAEIEIYNVPYGSLVDIAVGGAAAQSDNRGGMFTVTPGGRQAEVIAGSGNAGFTGPVIFRGVEPDNGGTVRVQLDAVTFFCYLSFMDIRVYRR